VIPRFNTTGPCIPGEHYMLPPERRLRGVLRLIDEHRFFTLHAGRQTGKTTSLMWLEEHLSATRGQRAVWVDIEIAREKPDVARAMTAILTAFDDALALRHRGMPRPEPAEIDGMLAKPDSALLA
jgi:hypothetical protein